MMLVFSLLFFMSLPLALLLSAVIVDHYVLKNSRSFFSLLAIPWGVVIFFDEFLSSLSVLGDFLNNSYDSTVLLSFVAQLIWMGTSFALVIILIALVCELPFRWFAAKSDRIHIEGCVNALRLLVVLAVISFFIKNVSDWFYI